MFNSSKIPLRGFVRRALAPVVRDRRANTAMIFALAFLPLLSVVGFAVDHNRHITAQNKVQTALDHAALATAKRMAEENMSDDEVDQAARDFFAAQFVATGGIAIDPIDAAEVGD